MSDPMPFASHQNLIYLTGLAGKKPSLPVNLEELESRALEVLSPEAHGYVGGGAGKERTMQANLASFDHWQIMPRMMRDVANRDLSVELLGTKLNSPVMIAPIGVQGIVHADGELATARAAQEMGIPYIVSTASSYTLEQIAQASKEVPRWFQLYWPSDNAVTESLLQRAETAGYRAIVVTLDTRMLAWRERDLQQAFLPFLTGQGLANYFSDPAFRQGLDKPPEEDIQSAVLKWMSLYSDLSHTWDDLKFLRSCTKLPIVLKGILDPQDAKQALDSGVDGIIVSNHGGRQIDGSVAALDCLPEVVEVVADQIPVLFDSGIRRGADAIKALALGAKTVLLGRPAMWGLAIEGQAGVEEVLRRFLADFDLTMALCGCASLEDLSPEMLKTSAN